MTERAPLLRLTEVGRSFAAPSGRVDALRRASLALSPGEFVVVTGPSGSGKSTLLHLAALLDRPTAGSVAFDGREVSALGDGALRALRARSVGMVFQRHHLLPHRSVLENVAFRFRYLDHGRAEARRLAAEALVTVGLGGLGERPARLLSGGELQRVAVARAIAFRPRLLVADEPTGNLDAAAGSRVMACLEELHRTGIAVLMVTHDPSILGGGHRTVVCRDGCLEG
ncbi:MAG TPA: ABC transporter ATP-binding protein [Anaeromyxobacteraceae bacterium]|nr:ABC transporter ATP-binding protein [Anaeromyxobacteraceae bacterium]